MPFIGPIDVLDPQKKLNVLHVNYSILDDQQDSMDSGKLYLFNNIIQNMYSCWVFNTQNIVGSRRLQEIDVFNN